MAVRQYIGARYVPTYYQNSQDPTSSEWEPNVKYDPLTIVSLPNMHSYQSKKMVPANIGSPAQNPEYWYDQGYAQAYYQALQDQIDDMKDGSVAGSLQEQINDNTSDITDLTNVTTPHIILVGDSYDAMGGNCFDVVIAAYPDIDIKKASIGGASFANAMNPGQNSYQSLLAGMPLTSEEKQLVNRIIIMGGYNEVNDVSNISAGTLATINYIKSNFPNAEIEFMPVGNDAITTTNRTILACMDTAIGVLLDNGCRVYDNAKWILSNRDYKAADNIHPNSDGKSELVKYLKSVVLYKQLEINRSRNLSCNAPPGLNYTISSNGAKFVQHNGIAYVEIPDITITANSGTTGRTAITAYQELQSFMAIASFTIFGKVAPAEYPMFEEGLQLKPTYGTHIIEVINNTASTKYYGVNAADSGGSSNSSKSIRFILDLYTSSFSWS